jgi:hypothetical protein
VKTNNHDPTPARRRIATEEPFSISELLEATLENERRDPARLTVFMRVYAGCVHKRASAADRGANLLGELRRAYGFHVCELRNQPACTVDHASRMLDELRRTYETLALEERRQVRAFIGEISAARPSRLSAINDPRPVS